MKCSCYICRRVIRRVLRASAATAAEENPVADDAPGDVPESSEEG